MAENLLSIRLALTGISSVSAGLNEISARVTGFGKAIGVGLSGLLGAGGLIGGLGSIAGIAAGLKDALDMGGRLSDMSAKTGIATKSLVILEQAFKDSGLAAEQVGTAVAKMQDNLVSASRGGGGPAEALGLLRLNAEALLALQPDEQFAEIGRAIASINDPATRTAVTLDIFGKSSSDLLTLFRDSSVFDVAAQRVGGLAGVMQRSAAAFDAISDAFGSLGVKLRGLFAGMAESIVPELTRIAELINSIDLTPIGQRMGDAIGLALQEIAAGRFTQFVSVALGAGFEEAVDQLRAMLVALFGLDQGLFNAISRLAVQLGMAIRQSLIDAFSLAAQWFTGGPLREMADRFVEAMQQAQDASIEANAALLDVNTSVFKSNREELKRMMDEFRAERQAAQSDAIQLQSMTVRGNLGDQRFQPKADDSAYRGSYVGGTQEAFNRFQASAAIDDQAGAAGGITAGWQQAMMDLGTVAQQAGNTVRNTIGAAITSVSAGITGLIMGTQTWAGALRQIAGSIINELIQGFVKMFAAWISRRLAASAAEKSAALGEAAAKAPGALMDSISSWGIAAAVGGAAFVAAMALAGGFKSGGFTGAGSDNQVAGVAHANEFVFNARAVRAAGLANLEAIHSNPRLIPMLADSARASGNAQTFGGPRAGGSGAGVASRASASNFNFYFDRREFIEASRDDIEAVAVDVFRRMRS